MGVVGFHEKDGSYHSARSRIGQVEKALLEKLLLQDERSLSVVQAKLGSRDGLGGLQKLGPNGEYCPGLFELPGVVELALDQNMRDFPSLADQRQFRPAQMSLVCRDNHPLLAGKLWNPNIIFFTFLPGEVQDVRNYRGGLMECCKPCQGPYKTPTDIFIKH